MLICFRAAAVAGQGFEHAGARRLLGQAWGSTLEEWKGLPVVGQVLIVLGSK